MKEKMSDKMGVLVDRIMDLIIEEKGYDWCGEKGLSWERGETFEGSPDELGAIFVSNFLFHHFKEATAESLEGGGLSEKDVMLLMQKSYVKDLGWMSNPEFMSLSAPLSEKIKAAVFLGEF
jgi:hypothetical protein